MKINSKIFTLFLICIIGYLFSADQGTYNLEYKTFTPNNTLVVYAGVLVDSTELDANQVQDEIDFQETNFENATLWDNPTRKYNCHGYAWHMYPGDTSDEIWIAFSDPIQAADAEKTYWEDGSYVQVNYTINSQQKPKNSIVFYDYVDPNDEHSAYSNVLDEKTVISKWGEGVLAIHDYDDCPYYEASVDMKFYIRAGQITQFGNYGITNLKYNSESNHLLITKDENKLIDVKFDNSTPDIQDNINYAKLYYEYDSTNYPLSETIGIIEDYEWDLSTVGFGSYKLFAEVGYIDNPINTLDTLYIDILPNIEIDNLENNEVQHKTPPNKEGVIDTLAIKIAVDKVNDVYPEIDILIDDVAVNSSEIVLENNLWVYYWDLSSVNAGVTGTKYKIESIVNDFPKAKHEIDIYLVETLLYEDFEVTTDLVAEGWVVSSYEYPPQTYTGWYIGNDPAGTGGKSAKSLSTYSLSFAYKLYSTAFVVPDASSNKTKLEYRLYFNKLNPPNTHSYMKFYVCDETNATISDLIELGPIDGEWMDFNYDLSEYSGQTIKLLWWHYYSSGSSCNNTTYGLDNVVVYAIPDMDSPNIDFIYGNHAELDEDMNINLEFNDLSGIGDVTADYEIEGDSETIILSPAKDSYNYVGTITSRDHECAGNIVFKIKDSVGNETISTTYSMVWSTSAPILTAPENLLITMENDSTTTLTWDIVAGATEYKVYVSEDPYGTFTLDTLGTFISGTEWQKSIDTDKIFYYIVAANASKSKIDEKDIEYDKLIWREEENRKESGIKETKEKKK